MNCQRCGGLAAEPGKSYCYAGKFCHCAMRGQDMGGLSQPQPDAALGQKLDEILNILKRDLKDKEPCKHEPIEQRSSMIFYRGNEQETVQEFGDPFYTMKCKHCGAKIKATGWEKV